MGRLAGALEGRQLLAKAPSSKKSLNQFHQGDDPNDFDHDERPN
jgi:hypothetical protein